MKPPILLLFVLMVIYGCSQTAGKQVPLESNLSFTVISPDEPDILNAGRGAEQWHDRNDINIPYPDSNTKGTDKYYRFAWTEIEKVRGQYDWTVFDAQINDAIDHRQQFSFGIMPLNPLVTLNHHYAVDIDGKPSILPRALHDAMQREPVKDWISHQSNTWIPNWNSQHYINALRELHFNINKHLDTGTYKGVPYKNVINYIDVRGYGNYGEWHEAYIVDAMSDHPPGTAPTVETLKAIIDAHVSNFASYKLVLLFSVFDGNRLRNTMIPPEVAHYALQAKTKKGPLGWRRDNWGATDGYIDMYLSGNTVKDRGKPLRELILDRWKTSPVVGEPSHSGTAYNGCDYGNLEAQIEKYHASSFGNGNISNKTMPCIATNVRAAARRTGYRLLLTGGMIAAIQEKKDSLHIRLDWKNEGVAPTYDHWEVWYQLRDFKTDSLVWRGQSTFDPYLFLPADTSRPAFDAFRLPASLPTGNYNLSVIIIDPVKYRRPLALAIRGKQPDDSYTLRTIEIR